MVLHSKKILSKIKNLPLHFLSVLILALGIILQLQQYFANRSLWLDEAMLANNVLTHSLHFLMGQPLDSEQAAPLGFLFGLKLLGKLFGYQDQVLRLVPLVFGLGVLVISFLFKNRFKHQISQFLFLSLYAFSPILIYYSSEVKQYILDVFFTLLILWVGLNFKRWKYGKLILLASGIGAIFFSNPSVFILASAGITQITIAIFRKERQNSFQLLSIGIVWLLCFVAIYFLISPASLNNKFLKTYWGNSFALPLYPLSNLKWYFDSAMGLAYIGFSASGPVPPGIISAWYSPINYLILICLAIGIYAQFRSDQEWLSINIIAILVTCIVSGLALYPFRSRPVIFLIPIIFSLLCVFSDSLLLSPNRPVKAIGTATILLFVGTLLVPSIKQFLHPVDGEDIKGALTYINQHHLPGDQYSVSEWSTPAYQFYRSSYPMEKLKYIGPFPGKNDPVAFMKNICENQQFGRIWIIFSHRYSERIHFLDELRKKTPLIDSWESAGAGAFLFDFSDPSFCQSLSLANFMVEFSQP